MTEVDWQEVQRESIGGHHNASAYCLVYVQSKGRPQKNEYIPSNSKAIPGKYIDKKKLCDFLFVDI